MSRSFYRFWLPFSIAAHVLLLFALLLIKPTEVTGTDTEQLIDIVPIAATKVPDKPVEVTPPVKPAQPKAVKVGVPHPQPKGGPGQNPVISPTPGKGKTGPTIAVNMMTVKHSTLSAPKGDPNGMGTAATGGLGESGPSEGAGVLGSLHGGNSKIAADEHLDGSVTVKVNVSATGAIDVSIVRSSGNSELDNAAKRAARASHYQPALKNGQPVAGSVTILFPFNDGKGLTPSILERN